MPISGGIPLCFPWFGPATNAQATAVPMPAHGFARRLDWRLLHHHNRDSGSELVFELTDSPTMRALWPQGFVARVHLLLGAFIRLGFRYDCVGADAHPATAALHSYLHVSDIARIALHGLGPRYQEHGQLKQAGPFTRLHGVTDRIYTAPSPYSCIGDMSYQRRLSLWHRGHSEVVLWNPWQALIDAPEQQWRNFVCVETARVLQPLASGAELAVEIVEA